MKRQCIFLVTPILFTLASCEKSDAKKGFDHIKKGFEVELKNNHVWYNSSDRGYISEYHIGEIQYFILGDEKVCTIDGGAHGGVDYKEENCDKFHKFLNEYIVFECSVTVVRPNFEGEDSCNTRHYYYNKKVDQLFSGLPYQYNVDYHSFGIKGTLASYSVTIKD